MKMDEGPGGRPRRLARARGARCAAAAPPTRSASRCRPGPGSSCCGCCGDVRQASTARQAPPPPLEVLDLLAACADVALVFDDGRQLPADRGVLSVHSPVLRGALGGGARLALGPAGIAQLPAPGGDADARLVALAIPHIQEGARLDHANLRDVLALADKYGLKCVMDRCERILRLAAGRVSQGRADPEAWDCFVLAAEYRFIKTAKVFCTNIFMCTAPVARGFDLGAAAPLLTKRLSCARSKAPDTDDES
jgi:hypothetical protein